MSSRCEPASLVKSPITDGGAASVDWVVKRKEGGGGLGNGEGRLLWGSGMYCR